MIIWLVAFYYLLSCSLLIVSGIISVVRDQLAGKVGREALQFLLDPIPSGWRRQI